MICVVVKGRRVYLYLTLGGRFGFGLPDLFLPASRSLLLLYVPVLQLKLGLWALGCLLCDMVDRACSLCFLCPLPSLPCPLPLACYVALACCLSWCLWSHFLLGVVGVANEKIVGSSNIFLEAKNEKRHF
jgi:hypothetical protein